MDLSGPGGRKKCGMGKDFYEKSTAARQIYDEASRLLGLDMAALCFEENERLDQTEYTQAALVTTCLAMAEALRDVLPAPDVLVSPAPLLPPQAAKERTRAAVSMSASVFFIVSTSV